MIRSFLGVLLLSVVWSDLHADEVVTIDRRGKTRSRQGTIVDFKDRELTLLVSGREVKIPAEAIQRVETNWLPSHTQADELFDRKQYEQALDLYRTAFGEDERRWVKRRVLARVICCQANTGRLAEACHNFSRLTTDDPHTNYFDVIPLAWNQQPPPAAVIKRVLPWLSSDSASDQLMAASWLLKSSDHEAALRSLRTLGRAPWEPLAKLAVAQMWRDELPSIERNRLEWWEQHLNETPIELRAGSYYLLGLTYEKFDDTEQAELALMRLPIQYPHQRSMVNSALLRCGEIAHRSGRTGEAKRYYLQLAQVDESSRELAQERIIQLHN